MGSRLAIDPECMRTGPPVAAGTPDPRVAPTAALDSHGHVPSPTSMGNLRRPVIAAAGGRGAARPRVPVRARLPGPRRLSAPQPSAVHAGRPRPAVRVDAHRIGRRRPAGLVHPGPRWRAAVRASSSSTAGNRPAIGRCPMAVFLHAAGFHCLTFDVRGNGANPAEDAAAHRRRVRARRPGRLPAR